MSDQRITLDNPVFAGRLKVSRQPVRRAAYARRPVIPARRLVVTELYEKQPAQIQPPTDAPVVPPVHEKPYSPITPQIAEVPPVQPTHVKEAQPKRAKKTKRKSTRTRAGTAMFAMATILFVFGLTVGVLGLKTNKHVEAQVTKVAQAAASTQDASTADAPPEEKKPDTKTYGTYTVPTDHPRYLTIPKISVNARIRALGTKDDGELLAPNNIYDAGWYQSGAKPGDKNGAILIDGHVHGIANPGVFMNLKRLVAGDVITIERGDGVKQSFRVVKTQSYGKDSVDMQAAVKSVDPAKLGLNLITCTGSVKGNEYQERLIIFAVAE